MRRRNVEPAKIAPFRGVPSAARVAQSNAGMLAAHYWGGVPKWLRERSAKPPFSGSNPLAASFFATRSAPANLNVASLVGTGEGEAQAEGSGRCATTGDDVSLGRELTAEFP